LQANTPPEIANSAALYANAAFIQANAAYAQANSGGAGTDTYARDTANASFVQANAAFVKANTTSGNGVVRVVTVADITTITMNANTSDIVIQTNTQLAGTLTVATSGTPLEGQKIILRLQSANVQTFSWDTVFAGSTDMILPTVSSANNKYDYMGFIYNSISTKWQLIAKNFGF
jgi:guanyl-specific ribonuclease Sa